MKSPRLEWSAELQMVSTSSCFSNEVLIFLCRNRSTAFSWGSVCVCVYTLRRGEKAKVTYTHTLRTVPVCTALRCTSLHALYWLKEEAAALALFFLSFSLYFSSFLLTPHHVRISFACSLMGPGAAQCVCVAIWFERTDHSPVESTPLLPATVIKLTGQRVLLHLLPD